MQTRSNLLGSEKLRGGDSVDVLATLATLLIGAEGTGNRLKLRGEAIELELNGAWLSSRTIAGLKAEL